LTGFGKGGVGAIDFDDCNLLGVGAESEHPAFRDSGEADAAGEIEGLRAFVEKT
jgi:hypothetical protein